MDKQNLKSPDEELPLLNIKFDDNTKIKAIPLYYLIKEMEKIEYEMDKMGDFSKFYPEYYQVMWNTLKKIMMDNLK